MKYHFPYNILDRQQIIEKINLLAVERVPFLFIIDYKARFGFVIKQDELDVNYIQFHNTKLGTKNSKHKALDWKIQPVALSQYQPRFEFVINQIKLGNSFLTNLTLPTAVSTNFSLKEIFDLGSAKYKLWLRGQFVVFSPETFVRIEGQTISSYPMKGTIDAAIPNAEQILLNDSKEKAEHATIVDLIRNDLSLVAENVEVKRYRYVEKLTTNKHDLLQVSSEISGQLRPDFHKILGNILFDLLPAGSICGAPKAKTLEIIEQAEGYERGFYSGVCGYFDGQNLDSAVMIRFIEQDGDRLVFKSGGGITAQSDMQKEYEELIQKVYVPIS